MALSKLQRARWTLKTLKKKHGFNCKCSQCISWMTTISRLRKGEVRACA